MSVSYRETLITEFVALATLGVKNTSDEEQVVLHAVFFYLYETAIPQMAVAPHSRTGIIACAMIGL